MNDLISRQAAIDAAKKLLDYYGTNDISKEFADHTAERFMNWVPPAQQWIPCSEGLPEEYGEYLVTKHTIGWNCEEYDANDIAYFDDDGFHKADRVIAWMPLPEPYKGEES